MEKRAFPSEVVDRIVRGSVADWKSRLAKGCAVPNKVVVPATVPEGRSVRLKAISVVPAWIRWGTEARFSASAVTV